MYVMMSAQEFCDRTGVSLSTFKTYRAKFRNLPDEGRFPTEVYEYKNTVVFDSEELCEWWLDWYESFIPHHESTLAEAVKTLQDYFNTRDLDSVRDLHGRVFTSMVPYGMHRKLEDAYRVYQNYPGTVLELKKLQASVQALTEEIIDRSTS